jgi:hypothetical protein
VAALAVVVLLGTGRLARAGFFEFQNLLASDGASGDAFGYSVDLCGDYAIVGAVSGGSWAGAAYVFNWTGTTWTQQAKLTASDAAVGDNFGASVAISGDYAIVGAHGNEDAGNNTGSAYVFNRSGSAWSQQAKLTASDAAADDEFGRSVGISGDYAIVGGRGNDDAGSASGSAYVFNRSGTAWSEQAKLTASDAALADYFGHSVGISGDYAIVGAYADDDAGSLSGSAYVFNRSGTAWSEQAKLTASDAALGDFFGRSVDISGDDAIVGAERNGDAGNYSGSAYVFNRSGTAWSEQAKLTASDAAAWDYFGSSVGISGDYAIVGAYGDDFYTGSAYVFDRSGSAWSEQAKLTASDAVVDDRFGESVGIWGERAIVGAHSNDDLGHGSGSAYVYHTPEPSGMVALVGLGLMGCAAHLWRRRKRNA